ncbi:MAG: spermidine/putrescine ABC transporter substrate-binding protein [Anaerolineae bacterium]|nr:spermidine/putrescine ABC transporter substrate-binding protein [Anaerolineae bacterium]
MFFSSHLNRFLITSILILVLVGCTGSSEPTAPPPADELILYDWAEDVPQSVLDAFTQEYGTKVTYLVYESQEEAIDQMRSGQAYDVVVMESRFVPLLVEANLLAEIDFGNVPNFKNISANFRNLVYDPDNRYSIPYNWGVTGLVVRSDLVEQPVTRWADLWDPRYAGKIAIWAGQSREVIALTLKSLGFSGNTEDPRELQAALDHLLEIRPHVLFIEDFGLAESSDLMASGQVVISMGYATDVIVGQTKNPDITFVMPEEGALMWNDTFVIPANGPHKYTAELFLNFLLRPEISAQMINEHYYPMANEAAEPFIDPAIRDNPVIYPPDEVLRNAELIVPLSVDGQQRYLELWERFLAKTG